MQAFREAWQAAGTEALVQQFRSNSRERPRPAFVERGGAFESAGESFSVRTWVGLTGREQQVGARTITRSSV